MLDKNKALTTKFDFSVGIGRSLGGLDPLLLRRIELVAVSSTLATNAVVEDQGCKVGLLLMLPYDNFNIEEIGHDPKAVISGRMTIEGKVEQQIDASEILRIVRRMKDEQEVSAFAVSGFGGAINPSLEIEAGRIIREETGCFVSCGHELSELLDFRQGPALLSSMPASHLCSYGCWRI